VALIRASGAWKPSGFLRPGGPDRHGDLWGAESGTGAEIGEVREGRAPTGPCRPSEPLGVSVFILGQGLAERAGKAVALPGPSSHDYTKTTVFNELRTSLCFFCHRTYLGQAKPPPPRKDRVRPGIVSYTLTIVSGTTRFVS